MGLPVPGSSRSTDGSERTSDSSSASLDPIWLRLEAFLSLKSPNTRHTYLGILKDWCLFLCRQEPGTKVAASAVAAATDLHAAAYRKFLESQPGERPRSGRRASNEQPSAASKTSSVSRTRSDSRDMAKGRRSYANTSTDAASGKKEGLESTLSNATIAKKFAALRRMYRVLLAHNLAGEHNPFDTDRTPAPPKDAGRKRPTEMVDFSFVEQMLACPDCTTEKGRRDAGILSALFGGALRRSEVINLRLADLRKTPQGTAYLYLRSTKAKKDALQALPSWAAQALEVVVADRKKHGAKETNYLFIGYTGRAGTTPSRTRISPAGLYQLFRQYAQLAGVSAHVTPHSARATAITKLLADGIPHRKVQEFSRHASIQMVEVYDKRRVSVDENPAGQLEFGEPKRT